MTDIKKIKRIIADKLRCDIKTIKEESTFADLGADSIDSIELIMRFEEEYNIEITDKDAKNIKTVGDIINYINIHNT